MPAEKDQLQLESNTALKIWYLPHSRFGSLSRSVSGLAQLDLRRCTHLCSKMGCLVMPTPTLRHTLLTTLDGMVGGS